MKVIEVIVGKILAGIPCGGALSGGIVKTDSLIY